MNKFNIDEKVWFFGDYSNSMPMVIRGTIVRIRKEKSGIEYLVNAEKSLHRSYEPKEEHMFTCPDDARKCMEKLINERIYELNEEIEWTENHITFFDNRVAEILKAEAENETKEFDDAK